MGLVAGVVDDGDAATLSAAAGQRIICVAWNRSGATTFGVTPNAGGGTWVNRLVEATLPTNDEARRSLAVAELLTTSTVSAVSFTAAWNTGGTDALWMVVEEGTGYDFADVAVADSGTSVVSSLATGSTLDIAAGDVLAIAALASRDGNSGNVTWSTTNVNPPLVGGGSILLDHYGGVGTGGGNAGAAGYLSATSQPEQSYSDTVTLPGAGAQTRHLTAALLVWSLPESAVELSGSMPTASGMTGDLSITKAFASSMDSASGMTGSLSVSKSFSASMSTADGMTGSLSVSKSFSATMDSASDLTGVLSVSRSLASSMDNSSGMVGDLTVVNTVGFSATMASAGGMVGSLSVSRSLASSMDNASDLTGNLSTTLSLSSSMDNASGMTGALSTTRPLAASMPTASDMSANLTVSSIGIVSFSADLPSASGMVGDLSIESVVGFSANLPTVSGMTADLTVESGIGFSADLPTASGMGAALTVLRPMSASMPTASGMTGNLDTGATGMAELTGTATVLGLSGTVSAVGLAGGAAVKGLAGTVT
jgi:hypothetical protein